MTLDSTGKPASFDQAIEAAVEGEIREFVRRDSASLRWTPETDSELVANNILSLLQRVAAASAKDIDGVIAELQTLSALLQEEGARVEREVVEYAHLSQSAMQSTKFITESLAQRKTAGASSPSTAAH